MTQSKADDHIIIARLNSRLKPMDRGQIFEDPLDDTLKELDLGEVTGGGSQLTAQYEIAYCEIEISLKNLSESTIQTLISRLENLGAPIGSSLILDHREIPFGKMEGLAIYLNGTDLPEEVYEKNDINDLYSEIEALIGGAGLILGYWDGPESTAIYLYGPSVAVMKEKLADYLKNHPLCQLARLEQIAG